MPGFDEATPRPPLDPTDEAARLAREKELLAKLEALEARAAMTDPTRPGGDTADSDTADSEVAGCDCVLDTEDCTDPAHPAANLGATEPTPRAMFQALGDHLRRQGEAFNAWFADLAAVARQDAVEESQRPPGPAIGIGQVVPPTFAAHRPPPQDILEPINDQMDPVANVRAAQKWITSTYRGVPGVQVTQFDRPVPLRPGQTYEATYTAPSAYQRGMQIARDGSEPTEPVDLDAFRVAVTQGSRPRFDTLSDDHLDVLYDLIARGQRETWDRQATVIAKQAKEIGDLKRAVEETDTERAFQRDLAQKHWAAIQRVREIHRPVECVNVRCTEKQWCIGCDPHGDDLCSENPWPCPTIRALDDTPEQP